VARGSRYGIDHALHARAKLPILLPLVSHTGGLGSRTQRKTPSRLIQAAFFFLQSGLQRDA